MRNTGLVEGVECSAQLLQNGEKQNASENRDPKKPKRRQESVHEALCSVDMFHFCKFRGISESALLLFGFTVILPVLIFFLRMSFS